MDPFLDEITLTFTAGHGGKGAVSFRREANMPKGGPDGGNGGKGADVVLRCDRRETTFYQLRSKKMLTAPDGNSGTGGMKDGKSGEDLIIAVPEGTVVYNEDGTVAADLIREGDQFVAARGGKGGKGNVFYATSRNQTPDYAQHGLPGEVFSCKLVIKLIADVGLVGFPNAGKSTLISHLTKAHPKIAPYPFTTLTPHLGVCYISADASFIIADIPGILEGAHTGVGLGIQFLKHIERTRILAYIIDLYENDPFPNYMTLVKELEAYKTNLTTKPSVIVLNKIDVVDREMIPMIIEDLKEKLAAAGIDTVKDILPISGVTSEGLAQMAQVFYRLTDELKRAESEKQAAADKVPPTFTM
ncbi:MAG: GTPase ObgE [Spirochaetes bacterium]|nr:GTPase ObgE [Spirochaetota bacterium]